MKDLDKLHTNQRLLVQELINRGVLIDILIPELEIVEARLGAHLEILLDRDSSVMPYAASMLCADKYISKQLLKRIAVPVSNGEQFFPDQISDAIRFAESLAGPVVIKPSVGSHGESCYFDLKNQAEIVKAIDLFCSSCGSVAFLLEEQLSGPEYRVFINRHGSCAVLRREPAYVIGDGLKSILDLVQQENQRRKDLNVKGLCPIIIDQSVIANLHNQQICPESILPIGAKQYLRRNANQASGGLCHDCTDTVPVELLNIAYRALSAFPQLPYAGIDLIECQSSNISNQIEYKVLEVNSNPGLKMHMWPATGLGRNVAAYVADMIFPETLRGKYE